MSIQEYINPELLVLVVVLYLFGLALKKSKLNDKWIPYILGAVSIVLCALWVVSTTPISGGKDVLMAIFTSIVQGILVAGASVYINQLYLQAKK